MNFSVAMWSFLDPLWFDAIYWHVLGYIALPLIAIFLAFKGIDLAKRGVNKA